MYVDKEDQLPGFLAQYWPLLVLCLCVAMMLAIAWTLPQEIEKNWMVQMAFSFGGPPVIFLVSVTIAAWPALFVFAALKALQKRL